VSSDNRIKDLYDKYEDELHYISRSVNIELPAILAVLQVETNDNDGFEMHPDGSSRLIIRVELHKFKKYLKLSNRDWDKVAGQFRWDADKPWKGQQFRSPTDDKFYSFHGNQFNEYFVFANCCEMDKHAAHMSISMGLPQIMGFNYEAVGYSTPQMMYSEFALDTITQIQGMMQFMDRNMKNALRKRDFVDFAKRYNGSGQAIRYGAMIEVAEREIAEWYEV